MISSEFKIFTILAGVISIPSDFVEGRVMGPQIITLMSYVDNK